MTPQTKRVSIAVGLFAVALGVGIGAVMTLMSGPAKRTISVSMPATTRKAYAHNDSAMLGRLDLMRQAVTEADIPDAERQTGAAEVAEVRARIVALLDNDAISAADRDAQLDVVHRDFNKTMRGNQNIADAMNQQIDTIWFELDLLSRRRLLPLMFQKLTLTDAQHKAADAAFMEMSVVLHNEPAGGAPNERSMQAMLTSRDKLHALLTPEQRESFKKVLLDEKQARERVLSHRLPLPAAPATATTSHVAKAPATLPLPPQ